MARRDAAILARAAGASSLKGDRLNVSVTIMPPDARRRDVDGVLSSLKASLDGIADVTGIDDSNFNLSIRRGDIVPNGLVRLELDPVTA